MPSSGNPSTEVHQRRSPSLQVPSSPPESRHVAVLRCCPTRCPLPHELSARTPTTSTAYRSAESCTGQPLKCPVLMLRPYSSAESSASPAAHKDADKRIG